MEKAKEAAEESLKLNNTLIDYIDLGAKGGPTKVTTYAKGGNPEVLNYAYMGGPTEVLAFCYGMLSPEMVQLFGQNDERLNQFFKTVTTVYTTLTKVQELLCGILRLLILSFSLCLWECVLPKFT